MMRYHGTDENSADDIVRNGLSRKKWQRIVAREGGDPTGFSLTEDQAVARQHAVKAATLRGGKGAVIAADDGELPTQATGDGTQSFDPGESKILPADMKDVGPGVFKVVEKEIHSLSPPATP
jgi:hypothetical protein